MAIESVPIRTNKALRPSRPMRNSADYAKRSTLTIIRVFMIYKPIRFFAWPGIVLLIAGGIIGLQFLMLYVLGGGQGHVQSLILAAMLIVVGAILCIFSLIAADLIAVNRRLLEELQTRMRSLGRLSSPSGLIPGLILIGDAAQVQSTPAGTLHLKVLCKAKLTSGRRSWREGPVLGAGDSKKSRQFSSFVVY